MDTSVISMVQSYHESDIALCPTSAFVRMNDKGREQEVRDLSVAKKLLKNESRSVQTTDQQHDIKEVFPSEGPAFTKQSKIDW